MGNKKNTTYDRRNFLKNTLFTSSALALNPFKLLLDGMVAGICDKAYAGDMNSASVVNYMHISMSGGCPRWMFDLPLKPNGETDSIGNNLMLVTGFDNVEKTSQSYQLVKHASYYFPKIWDALVSDGKGGLREIKPLLNHLISFRGVNLQIDGHELNRLKQDAPIAGGYSIGGLNVEKSLHPIPAVFIGSSLNFKSRSGIGIINASGSNPISTLLTPFQMTGAKSFGADDTAQKMINEALLSLEKHAETATPSSKSIFTDRKNAKKLFEREFGNLTDVYNDLANKYEGIIRETLRLNNMSFLDTSPIFAKENSMYTVQASAGEAILSDGFDLRNSIILDSKRNVSGDGVSNKDTTIAALSRVMAVGEYLLVNNLSSTINLTIGSLSNLMFETTKGTLMNQISNNDAHETGAISTMYFFTKYYLCISACLLELIERLKSANIFDNTVINLSSEFNRSARSNGSGSDHGWKGSSSTLFTGLTNAPLIVGDIQANYTGDSNRSGGWGVAAESESLSGRELLIGNVSSSICELLSIPTPTPNDQSLLSKSNLEVRTHVSKPKNI